MTATFNPLIHAPKRLRICAFLASVKEVEFRVLADTLGLTDSDLSKQIKALEQAGLVSSRKLIFNTRQKTWLSMTADGRAAFAAHREALQELLDGQSRTDQSSSVSATSPGGSSRAPRTVSATNCRPPTS